MPKYEIFAVSEDKEEKIRGPFFVKNEIQDPYSDDNPFVMASNWELRKVD